MDQMLDAGFCLPAIGFAFRRGGRGYWFLKVIIFVYPASSIQYPVSAHPDLNIRFQDFVFFGSGLSGLGLAEGFKYLILHQKKTV
jgi:hypothetical protein